MKQFLLAVASAAVVALPFDAAFATGGGEEVLPCNAVQSTFGGNGGRAFGKQPVDALIMRSGTYVDALIVNGRQHGGNGGALGNPLQFGPNEYIDTVVIRHGLYIDRLEFRTNTRQVVAGGGQGGKRSVLSNIRLLEIGGRSGDFLDQITIVYC